MSHPNGTFAYIGTKPCGHTVAAFVDRPEYAKEIAKEIPKWIRSGMKVDRVPVEDARTMLHFCECDKPKRQTKQERLAL